jgi:hypothetical protein
MQPVRELAKLSELSEQNPREAIKQSWILLARTVMKTANMVSTSQNPSLRFRRL